MRAVVGTVLAFALLVVSPGTAHAEHDRYNDALADVWAHRDGGSTQDVAHTDGDIRIVSIQHRLRTVRLRMAVQSIDADGGSSYRPLRFRFTLVNGRGLVKVFELTSDNVLRVRKQVGDRYVRSHCRRTRHSVNATNGEVRISLPRSCMRRPRALRLGALSLDYDTAGTSYVDDAYTTYDPTTASPGAGTSRWVRRG